MSKTQITCIFSVLYVITTRLMLSIIGINFTTILLLCLISQIVLIFIVFYMKGVDF